METCQQGQVQHGHQISDHNPEIPVDPRAKIDLHPKLTPRLVQRTPQVRDKHPGILFAYNKDANPKGCLGPTGYQM